MLMINICLKVLLPEGSGENSKRQAIRLEDGIERLSDNQLLQTDFVVDPSANTETE